MQFVTLIGERENLTVCGLCSSIVVSNAVSNAVPNAVSNAVGCCCSVVAGEQAKRKREREMAAANCVTV